MLRKDFRIAQEGELWSTFHVTIDAYDSGRIMGSYYNIPADLTEQHDVMSDLAGTLGNFMELKVLKGEIPKCVIQCGHLISDEVYSMCKRGGQKATFSIKIMFREHFTCQGIIYWWEGRMEQPFRSFEEMLYLMVSAMRVQQVSSDDFAETEAPLALGS
jgi:hypothetical protein